MLDVVDSSGFLLFSEISQDASFKKVKHITENIILESQVPGEGIANIWISRPEMFDYHKSRIKVGQKCFFFEGSKRIAEGEIIEITRLNNL